MKVLGRQKRFYRRRWLRVLTVLGVFLLFGGLGHIGLFAQEPRQTLIVGGDHNYPPYEFLADGKPAGFNVELIRAVAETAGFEVEIRLGPWHEVRKALEEGEIDVLAGMYYSEARDARVDFTAPHTHVSPGLFVRQDAAVRSLEDVITGSVLVQEEDLMHDFLREQPADGLQIVPVTDSIDALRLLSVGWHDAALLSSKMQGLYLIEQHNLTNLRAISVDIEPLEYCFAVQEGDETLAHLLTESLNNLKATGRYKEIYDRWFGVYERQNTSRTLRYVVWGSIVLLLILTGAVLWSSHLRREVRRRTLSLEEEIERRRDVETDLRLSEEKFRSIVRHAPVGIGVVSHDGEILDCNQALAEMLGYSREALLGRDFVTFTHPEDRETEREHLKAMWEGGASYYRMTIRYLHKEGRVIWADLSAALLEGERGVQSRRFVFVQEITEYKRMEEALMRRNQQLLLLQRATQKLSATLDLEEVFPIVLQAMQELLQATACSLWLVEEQSDALVCREASGPRRDLVQGWRLSLDEGLVGWVARHGETLVVDDATRDPRYFAGVDGMTGLRTRSVVSVPLQAQGRCLGAIQAIDERRGRFGGEDVRLLESFATSVVIAIENARLYEQAQREIAARKAIEAELRRHHERLEEQVAERTAELRTLVDAMTGREVRMAELKEVIKALRRQLKAAGLESVADDPLLGEEDEGG
ncbi:MAG: transporter substrate-binding domain-containing protein [Anaerolineae bacterium]